MSKKETILQNGDSVFLQVVVLRASKSVFVNSKRAGLVYVLVLQMIACLFVCLLVRLFVCLRVCLPVCLSVCLLAC